MSTSIDFDDIQVRDTVTRDYREIASTLTVAIRGAMAVYPNFSGRADDVAVRNLEGSTWRLVNRPKPAVELPTVPTLGWATVDRRDVADPLTALGKFVRFGGVLTVLANPRYSVSDVTAFVPATAVPTDALDDLRGQWKVPSSAVRDFLAAVDAANGPST